MSNRSIPVLTVIMPARNAMPFLRESVESVCRQTFRDWDFIIVNDGSSDESRDYLDSLDDPRIYVVHQSNQGPAAAFNRALAQCRSEFIGRMDADDVSREDRFEEQVRFLKTYSEIGLVGSQYEPFGAVRVGRRSHLPVAHEQIVNALLKGRHAICNPTVTCRTDLLKRIGGYRPDGVLEDWAMFLEMGEISRLANIDAPLLRYRIHAGSTNTQYMSELQSRIAYVCDRARRIRSGSTTIAYDEFLAARQSVTLCRRILEQYDVHAMVLYRNGLSDVLGGNPIRGFIRLAVSAVLSPARAWERLTRAARNRRSRGSTIGPIEPDARRASIR